MVGVAGDFVELGIAAGEALLVERKGDIGEQVVFPAGEGVCQQVVDAFVAGGVFEDVAEIYLDVDIAVFERAEIFAVVLHGVEEVARPLVDAVVDFHIGRDVAPVAIEQEHYVVDLAGG